jgi:hypothetical protein
MLIYRFPKARGMPREFRIAYHHGAGKGSSVGSAVKGLQNMAWAEADLYWRGHTHVRVSWQESSLRLQEGRVVPADVTFLSTGGYLSAYNPMDSRVDEVLGRSSNYVADEGMKPYTMGGASVKVRRLKGRFDVEVTL